MFSTSILSSASPSLPILLLHGFTVWICLHAIQISSLLSSWWRILHLLDKRGCHNSPLAGLHFTSVELMKVCSLKRTLIFRSVSGFAFCYRDTSCKSWTRSWNISHIHKSKPFGTLLLLLLVDILMILVFKIRYLSRNWLFPWKV